MMEIVLGESTPEEMSEAAAWVSHHQTAAVHKYGCLLTTADIKSLTLTGFDSFDSLVQGLEQFDEELELELELQAPPSLQGGVSCPVLLLYGGLGWQLHVRLHLEYSRSGYVKFNRGSQGLTPHFRHLIDQFEPAVGLDLGAQYRRFFTIVEAVYGPCCLSPPPSIELLPLSVLAGCAIDITSLSALNMLYLGGILDSTQHGDGDWARPLASLHPGLQCSLAGAIQQVSAALWVMVTAWVTHLFPDMANVTAETGLSAMELLNYWTNEVVKGQLTGLTKVAKFDSCTSRAVAVQNLGIPEDSKFDVLRLCPPWPTITAGGSAAVVYDKNDAAKFRMESRKVRMLKNFRLYIISFWLNEGFVGKFIKIFVKIYPQKISLKLLYHENSRNFAIKRYVMNFVKLIFEYV
jgi:hypothetical protein